MSTQTVLDLEDAKAEVTQNPATIAPHGPAKPLHTFSGTIAYWDRGGLVVEFVHPQCEGVRLEVLVHKDRCKL